MNVLFIGFFIIYNTSDKTKNPRPIPIGRGSSAFLGGMYMKIKTYKQFNRLFKEK